MIECPRCGDHLVGAIIIPLQERIILCADCNAFWDAKEQPVHDNLRELGSYFKSKGYKGGRDLLDIDWEKSVEVDQS